MSEAKVVVLIALATLVLIFGGPWFLESASLNVDYARKFYEDRKP